ncbi:MAG: sulfatase [Planctomycetes bacterium]|nr:sulfatase [Planctomycetota bacterium]
MLFCIADDASYPHMGAYGCDWVKTPAFDRVARQGLLFRRAYTPNAKCAPSRACILTGRNSWQLEAAANHIPYFPAKFTTYAETLAENGYFVGYTAKGWAPGDAGRIDGRPRQLTGQNFSSRRTKPPASGISACDYAANFRDFLAARPAGQPFCFWYGCYEPHRGYEFGSGIKKGGKSIDQIDDVPDFWPDNDTVRTDMLDYAFEIEWFDQHLQKMLDALDEIGQLNNTLVVVTADNGLPFPRTKGQEYEYSNHLPLAIMWPAGIKSPGRVIDDFVSFIDFAPTFLELAGVDSQDTRMQTIQGRSLVEIFRSQESGTVIPQRDHVLIGKERHDIGRPHDWGYPIRGIVKDGYLYLRNFEPTRWPAGNPETGYLNCDGSPTKTEVLQARKQTDTRKYWEWSFGKRPAEELFHLTDDVDCMNNLADDPAYRKIKDALAQQLTAELREQKDPRMFGQGYIFDEYPYANEGQRGFYERYMAGEKIPAGWVNPSDFESEPVE